jgi:hypothetical protein
VTVGRPTAIFIPLLGLGKAMGNSHENLPPPPFAGED